MIKQKIPHEIRDYEERLFLMLTKRQVISFTAALVLGTLEIIVLKNFLSMSALTYIVAFTLVPIGLIGFIKKDGLPMEQYLKIIIRGKYGVNQLTYRTNTRKVFQNQLKQAKEKKLKFNPAIMIKFDPNNGEKLDMKDPQNKFRYPEKNYCTLDDDSVAFRGIIHPSMETPQYRQYIRKKYKKGKPKEEAFLKVGDLIGE